MPELPSLLSSASITIAALILSPRVSGDLSKFGTTKIWSTGTVTLDGGILSTGSLTHLSGGTFTFNTGTLSITDSSQALTVESGQFSLANGSSFNTAGSTTTLATDQNLTIAGTTSIASGGTLTLNGGNLTTGLFSNLAGGTFSFNTGTLGITDTGQTLTVGVGDFSLTNGTTFNTAGSTTTLSANQHLVIAGATQIASGATLTLDGGSLTSGSLTLARNFRTGGLSHNGLFCPPQVAKKAKPEPPSKPHHLRAAQSYKPRHRWLFLWISSPY